MIHPSLAAARFGTALLMGAGLGLLHGFLGPPRRRFTALADLILGAALLGCWIRLSFAVCEGDITAGCTLGLGIGAVAWERTFGRLLQPVFRLFWLPFQKIYHFFRKFVKKLFASEQKWVTIYEQNHVRRHFDKGGKHREYDHQTAQADPSGLP